jgi:hypothetical protein
MSDLTHLEKRKFEQYLRMHTGYVLKFSDRTFSEFILDISGIDIFDRRYNYASGSKANRLRAFWRIESNAVVAKLMNELIEYGDGEAEFQEACRLIVARLRGDQMRPQEQTNPQYTGQFSQQQPLPTELGKLMQEFLRLSAESDRNRAGLDLERLLNRLFELFQHIPRQPFRVTGEQIDGSFELDANIYLLESKWEKHPLPEADLLIFRGKIEGKSTYTRGVFIALNGISEPARDAITRGKAPSFFVMTGHDLWMILNGTISLTDFLRKRVRLLGEEGAVYVPFSDL